MEQDNPLNPALYSGSMRSRAPQLVGTFVLLICLVCPVVEMFDTWDDTAQTGGDTEYALVLIALCLGAAYSFDRVILKLNQCGFFGAECFVRSVHQAFSPSLCCITLPLFEGSSPPGRPLRI
jgi:hypothetical protein